MLSIEDMDKDETDLELFLVSHCNSVKWKHILVIIILENFQKSKYSFCW